MSEHVWLNGELIPLEKAKISVLDHGILYGDGVFEGLRVYRGRPFMLAEHLQRLMRSAQALLLPVPYSEEALHQACLALIDRNGLDEGYMRLVVTRGEGSLGLDPSNCKQPSVFILYRSLTMSDSRIQQQGARLMTASVRRTPSDVVDPKIKTLNYLNNILAKTEANLAGMDDALLLNHAGQVAEASAANLFIVDNETLHTPPTSAGALEGITRGLVFELAEQRRFKVCETPMTLYDVYNADEAFLTGSGAELIPVAEVDGRRLSKAPGPVSDQLKQAFIRRTRGMA